MKTVALNSGTQVSALGQGTWHFGENRNNRAQEIAALQSGIDLGMTLIDTAEMYGEGAAEEVVGEAIAGRRDQVFVVSKVYPHHASATDLPRACENSLRRLKIHAIDLYLLHWRGSVPLQETVETFEVLRISGKIRSWGVSNFDVHDMEEIEDTACVANQVLYHPGERGIEFDLLPWCRERKVAIMAYSPIGHGGDLLSSRALRAVAERHRATPAQIALAWALRQPDVIAIPKASEAEHVRENVAAAEIRLTEEDLGTIDSAFPPPKEKRPLSML